MSTLDVSVLMAVYNGLPHLPAAVESILGQTLFDFEFVIIDDGSHDGSSEYLAGLRDPRVRVVRQENRGLGASLNRGLELIHTEFVARMDADDVSMPRRLQQQLDFARAHPEIGFFGTGFAFTLDGRIGGCGPAMPLTHEQIVAALARGGHALCHPTLFCKTQLIRSVGGYQIAGVGQDWDLFLRMSEADRGANLPEELLLYRLHATSNSWSSAYRTIIAKRYALHCAHCRRIGLTPPDFEAFVAEWRDANLLRRAGARACAASEVLYRQAIVARLEGRKGRALALLALASAANPNKVLVRTRRELHRRMNGWSSPC